MRSQSPCTQPTTHYHWDMEWEGLKRGKEQLKNTKTHNTATTATATTLYTCSTHTAPDRKRDKTKIHRLPTLRVQAQG